MFELQTCPAPQALGVLGADVTLRELPYGALRAAMAAAERPRESAERLLAASLHVDGAPIGFDALQGLPGRLAGGISQALQICMRLHGLARDEPGDELPNE